MHKDQIKGAAKEATELYLATDPDREGEAISWHLLEAIKPPKGLPVKRVRFNEITPAGIEKAMANPTDINRQLVDAQRARRVVEHPASPEPAEIASKPGKARPTCTGVTSLPDFY